MLGWAVSINDGVAGWMQSACISRREAMRGKKNPETKVLLGKVALEVESEWL